jgi:hypothetical protein
VLTIAKCTAKGAEYLDKKLPGWNKLIDCQQLDIWSHLHCVLGQLYGNYRQGKDGLGMSHQQAVEMGFAIEGGSLKEGTVRAMDLTAAWRKQIQARQAAA